MYERFSDTNTFGFKEFHIVIESHVEFPGSNFVGLLLLKIIISF